MLDRRNDVSHRARHGATSILTAFAVVAFASNSVLCRRALDPPTIDASSFASVRLVSGALTLVCIDLLRRSRRQVASATRSSGTWVGATCLFAYAVPFSFAYVNLATGTGALILFGCVQVTMFGYAAFGGERMTGVQWVGTAIAALGLVWLVLPGVRSPPLMPASLMAVAGVAWGAYSLRGRAVRDPLAMTAGNFARAVPLALLVSLATLPHAFATVTGFWLAIASGALASGLGYAVWYAVLPSLRASQAATVQLLVPVVAAMGGVAFVGEHVDTRLVTSGVAILGGVALALRPKRERPTSPPR